MKGEVVIAAALAQRPTYPGHAWALLHWVLGFRRLGWEVTLVDTLDAASCLDVAGRPIPAARSPHLASFLDLVDRFDLGDRYALRVDGSWIGLSLQEVCRRAAASDLLINVMGYLEEPEILGAADRRVFLDIDPGFGQMWHALGLADPFRGHDDFVTVGLNVGEAGCRVPDCGIRWIPTLPPVVLDQWPAWDGPGEAFRSVVSWRGPFGPIEFEGERYGLRAHQFRRFLDLPSRTGLDFELALDIHPEDTADLALLRQHGWRLVDPRDVAADPDGYQAYIGGSAGELMVAKDMYVRSGSGWFSDRSACFLASGRPVLAQDTGLSSRIPTGEGLVLFTTLDEAAAGAQMIADAPTRHRRAARAVAEMVFDSDRVLQDLLDALGSRPAQVTPAQRTGEQGQRVSPPPARRPRRRPASTTR